MADKLSKEATEIWMALPNDVKNKISSNVWCGRCASSVTIQNYRATLKGKDIVLNGFCNVCGHQVARVVEDCIKGSDDFFKRADARNQKQRTPESSKQKDAHQYYIFNVWLWGDENCAEKKKIIRRIQIAGTKNLYSFARVITHAFGFEFDHCFGFYDTLKSRVHCKKAFELFVDIGEEPTQGVAKGVKKIKISQAFDSVGEKMIFLFDYGDGWQFNVDLEEIFYSEKKDLKPVILKRIGKAPLQYPPCNDGFENDKE